MWKNQGSWNFFHTKLIPNSSITKCFLAKIKYFYECDIKLSSQVKHNNSKKNY